MKLNEVQKSQIRKIVLSKTMYLKKPLSNDVIKYPLDEETLFVLKTQLANGVLDNSLLGLPSGYEVYLTPSILEIYWANKNLSVPVTLTVISIMVYAVTRKN